MKHNHYYYYILVISSFMLVQNAQSQMMDDYGNYHPDSLTIVTVSGKAIVDNSMMYPMYYLDEDGDDQADYHLNFGPHWYSPDSSQAQRPTNGQQITIKGGSHESHMNNFDVVVVYEIDDLFWRDPIAPSWNFMGGHHNGSHHSGMGSAFGWNHDSIITAEVNGNILIDTTMYFTQFYLDSDQDTIPDYFLNFGPPWYESSNGNTRPIEGDVVSIIGGLINYHDLPMLIVYQINDQVWRDSSFFAGHFGGGWFHRDMDSSNYFHSPFDSLDGLRVHPGWHGGMNHGHGMMADSLFCQILEVFPQNIPSRGEHHILAGYEIAMFNPDGSNNMWMNEGHGGHMNFNNSVDFRLHYNDIQLLGENIEENSLQVKYWDDNSSNWIEINEATFNKDDNTVTFATDEVSNFVILTGTQSTTSIDDKNDLSVKGFRLNQNFPNPFNPETNIEFELLKSGLVKLSAYNVLGQKIVTLVDELMNSGVHTIKFQADNLPSGIYYYMLESNGQRIVRKMTLIK